MRVSIRILFLAAMVGKLLSSGCFGATFGPAHPMSTARYTHTATLLQSGKVLVAGGQNGSGALSSAEIYDPTTDTWSAAASLNNARYRHIATLLSNGRVLVAGGRDNSSYLNSAEIYDPSTNTWSAAASLTDARYVHTGTLLSNGKVLVAGGYNPGTGFLSSAELYDPVTDAWSAANNINTARYNHTATLMPSGKVLIAAGYGNSGDLNSAELYDPATNSWSVIASLGTAREIPTATLLSNGKLLVAGGFNGSVSLSSTELYDSTTDTWSPAGSLGSARNEHTATLLFTGTILVAGGIGFSGNAQSSAELFNPATNTWNATGSLNVARHLHTATLLQDKRVLITGGTDPVAGTTATCALFSIPIANAQTVTTHFNTAISLALIVSNANGNPLTYSIVQNPQHGVLTPLSTNGNFSYTPNLSYVGSDSFTFKANDGQADSNVALVSINVTDTAPIANAQSFSLHTGTAKAVMLTATDAENDALSYTITAQSAHGAITGAPPNLTYTSTNGYVGIDSFAFKANDGVFNSNIATILITVTDQSPIVSLVAIPTILIEGQSVAFNSGASDPEGDPLTFSWDFGDGGTATDANPTHVYAAAGVYTATITVADSSGATTTQSTTINVFHDSERPVARFTCSDLDGFVGRSLDFDAIFSTDPQNNIVSYVWDFGDGTPHETGQLISHVYMATGNYTVALTIINGQGLSDTMTLTMVVLPAAQRGLFKPSIKYRVNWDRSVNNSDSLSLSATVNVGTTIVDKASPLSLGVVGQTFIGTAATKLFFTHSNKSGPQVKWQIKANKERGAPKGTYDLTCTIKHASLGQNFALAGVTGTKSVMAKIPLRLGIGVSSFESSISSRFRFSPNSAKASGGGQGPN